MVCTQPLAKSKTPQSMLRKHTGAHISVKPQLRKACFSAGMRPGHVMALSVLIKGSSAAHCI